jgi:hypothetical protein
MASTGRRMGLALATRGGGAHTGLVVARGSGCAWRRCTSLAASHPLLLIAWLITIIGRLGGRLENHALATPGRSTHTRPPPAAPAHSASTSAPNWWGMGRTCFTGPRPPEDGWRWRRELSGWWGRGRRAQDLREMFTCCIFGLRWRQTPFLGSNLGHRLEKNLVLHSVTGDLCWVLSSPLEIA